MSISRFSGEYGFLSNFHPSVVEWDGVQYPSIENAYQAAKELEAVDREKYRFCTPGEAKRYGRKANLRPDWERIKVVVMGTLIEQKFAAGTVLANKLILTYPHNLVEGNHWHDHFWGVCNGYGRNELGKLLTRQRQALMA